MEEVPGDVRLNAADLDPKKLNSVALRRVVEEVQQQQAAEPPKTNKKAEFWWAVVGDAKPEPVAVTTENGRKVAYTIGCPDPIFLDEGGIVLIPPGGHPPCSEKAQPLPEATPMRIPMTPAEWQATAKEREKEWAKKAPGHRHRRWNP